MRPVHLLVCLSVALLLVACGGGEPAGLGDGPATATSDPASGTTPRTYRLEEALEVRPEGPVSVVGLLIDDGSGWRLCGAVAESYPPQCAGESVRVSGLDPDRHRLEEAQGVRWKQDATVLGELRGDELVVSASETDR